MSEKFKFSEFRDSFLGWFVLNAVSGPESKEAFNKLMQDRKDGEDRPYEFKFTIDGIEFPIVPCFKLLEEYREKDIQRAVKKYIEEKVNDFSIKISDMETAITKKMKLELFEKFGVEITDDDLWY